MMSMKFLMHELFLVSLCFVFAENVVFAGSRLEIKNKRVYYFDPKAPRAEIISKAGRYIAQLILESDEQAYMYETIIHKQKDQIAALRRQLKKAQAK